MIAVIVGLVPASARPSPPRIGDGADADPVGSAEISMVWQRDANARGLETELAFVPWRHVAIELMLGTAREAPRSQGGRAHEAGLALQWTPSLQGDGLRIGVQAGVARERSVEQGEPRFETERHAVMLFSYEWPGGLSVLVGPGLAHRRGDGASETVMTYELAAQYRLSRQIAVSAEFFGDEGGTFDKQLGLSYQLHDDVSVFVRLGQGNGRRFGGIGITFEFDPEP